VFRLSERQKWVFLSAFIDTDGWITAESGRTGITLANELLISDLREIFTHVGVVTNLLVRKNDFAGAWELVVDGDSWDRLADNLTLRLKGDKLERSRSKHRYSLMDVYPNSVVRGLPKGINRKLRREGAGHLSGGNYDVTRAKMRRAIAVEPLPIWEWLESAQVFWDKVVSLTDAGLRETFDVEVANNHNLITNGLVSHNSTTGELGVARVGAKLTRRFCLYVSLTQDQADYHITTIGKHLEKLGAEPSMNKMGRARGWRRDQLQTAHGFNVAGFGMDSALRGIKIDEFRPDLIWFDDIDSLEDTLDTLNKKIRAITLNILPAGSTDVAVLFTGNKVHSGSIISRLIDGRVKFLLNRRVKPAVPAVYDLEVESYIGANDLEQYRIIGGTASWPGGQPLSTCESQMNEWGYPAFMREAQHDVRVGGTFFPDFEDREPFVVPPRFTPDNPPPHWYTFRVGLDWGFADPYAYVLAAIDETGREHILESHEETQLKNEVQAGQVVKALNRWGIPIRSARVIADGTMWNKKTINGVPFPPDITAFHQAGLTCIPAALGKEADKFRNRGIRDRIREDGSGMVVYRGYNSRLVDCIMGAKHDPHPGRIEQLLHDEHSHLCVALGNCISTYDTPNAKVPNDRKTREEILPFALRSNPEPRHVEEW
jgi:hypothetical protein